MSTDKTLLVYATPGISLSHLAIEREVIENHFDHYQKKILVRCTGQLPSCSLNPVHNNIACHLCRKRTQVNVVDQFDWDKIYSPPQASREHNIELNPFDTVDELMAYSYRGIEIGRGIGSSLISISRDADYDPRINHELIDRFISQAKALVDFYHTILEAHRVTDVLLFNARFYEVFPLKELCKSLGINYYTHERGANFSKYQLIQNNTVHSIAHRKESMNALWNEAGPDKFEIANTWYKEKKEGAIKTETDFTVGQKSEELPRGFDPSIHNVSIFNSSEDEFKSIKEWSHDLFENQNEIIIRICQAMRSNSKVKFYLRFHPNLKGISTRQLQELNAAGLNNLEIIRPESSISTYALMLASDKVLSFGSRTAIESAYWNIPSITYGKNFYQSLDSLYNPKSFEELIALLNDLNLKSKKGDDLLKAAYFLQERGMPLRHVQAKSKNEVYYKNKRLQTFKKDYFGILKVLVGSKVKWKFNFEKFNMRKLGWRDLSKLK